MFNYLGILNKSSSVSHSITCNFLNTPSKLNLILAKRNILEIYDITKDGLESTPYLNIYGNIILLEKIQETGNNTDNILIVTDDMEYMILNFNKNKNEVVCVDKGCIKEDIGARQEKILYALDSNWEYIVISAYKNIFRVIHLKSTKHKSFTVRYDYDEALFLFPVFCTGKSQFGLVKVVNNYSSANTNEKNMYLDIFSFNLGKMEIAKDVNTYDISANPCISSIFSPKFGGVIVFYNNHLKYSHFSKTLVEKDYKTFTDRKFVAYTEIDRTRYLFVDESGNMFLLAYKDEKIVFQYLGEVNYASCLTYLDNNFVFIGSDKGNSQLVRITKKSNSLSSPFLEIIEEYDSLAPINDFAILNNGSEESNTEILCISGVNKTCSLKTIRKGTSINIIGRLDIEGVKNIFTVNLIKKDGMDIDEEEPNVLMFMTFIDRTELYLYNSHENSISSFKHGGLGGTDISKCVTRKARMIKTDNGKFILHVTDKFINIYSSDMNDLINSFSTIVEPVLVKYKKGYLYIYNKNNILLRYDINDLLSNKQQPEVLNDDILMSAFDISENMLIFSQWGSNYVSILNISSKKVFQLCEFEEEAFTNSISFIENDGIKFLFIALSNGKMLFYKLRSKLF
jgi:DNA damage-binding protein 1